MQSKKEPEDTNSDPNDPLWFDEHYIDPAFPDTYSKSENNVAEDPDNVACPEAQITADDLDAFIARVKKDLRYSDGLTDVKGDCGPYKRGRLDLTKTREEKVEDCRRKLAEGRFEDEIGIAAWKARAIGIEVTPGSLASKVLAREYLRVVAEINQEATDRHGQAQVTTSVTEQGNTTAKPEASVETLNRGTALFSEVWEDFEKDQLQLGKWKPNIARQNRSSAKLFKEICGNKTLSEYKSSDGTKFRRVLLGLPWDYSKNPEFRDTYLKEGPEQVSIDTEAEADIRRLAKKTCNRHFAAFSGFWEYAQKESCVASTAQSIFEGLYIKIPKGKKARLLESQKRPIWSDNFLRAVLSSNLLLGCQGRHAWRKPGPFVFRDERYWGVLFGPHHGMRREELFQLKVKHIRCDRENSIWHVDLFSDGLQLKDTGSPRYVPLHDNIIKLGFIEARVTGRSPEAFLFPEATPSAADKKRGDNFGKFFANFRWDIIDRLGEQLADHTADNDTPYENMVYHAARHTVTTYLYRAGVPIAHIEELIGHESGERRSEFYRYNKGQTLKALKEAVVDKLVLPIDLDAHLEAVRRSTAIDQTTGWPELDGEPDVERKAPNPL